MQRTMWCASAAAGVAVATILAIPSAAQAANNVSWSSGSYVRAKVWEDFEAGGHVITVFGSKPCTATLGDTETVMSSMSSVAWNDIASAANSYNSCDVNFFRDANYGGDSTGFRWYSSSGIVYLGDLWNDQPSSFKLS